VSTTGILWKKLLQPDNYGVNLEEICGFLLQNLLQKVPRENILKLFM
jgi:hypothetical protein